MGRLRTDTEPHLSTTPRPHQRREEEPLSLNEILKQIGRRLSIWIGVGAGILLVGFGGWWLLSPHSPVGSEAVVHVIANPAPFYEDPLPGIEQVPHQDKAIFQHLYPSSPGEGEPQIEHLLPPPEEPLLLATPVAVMNPFEPDSLEKDSEAPSTETPPISSLPVPTPPAPTQENQTVLKEIETEVKALKAPSDNPPPPPSKDKAKSTKNSPPSSSPKPTTKESPLSLPQPLQLPKPVEPQSLAPKSKPPTPPKTPPQSRSYQIQVGGTYPTQKHAQEAWTQFASRFPGQTPRIQRVPGLGGGGQYQILIGRYPCFKDAQTACHKTGGRCVPKPL